MAATQQDRSALYNDNKFKLGLFAANCSSGRAATKVAERWSGSWEDNLQLAQMADEAGIDFMLPIGRWKGYRGETNFHGSILEPTIWAAGLLAYTKRICVFSTIHAPLIHPIVAAKQLATADLIGRGRMGMNVVCGWNQDEFDMFGVDRSKRGSLMEEGVKVLRAAWTGEEFEYQGRRVRVTPRPGTPGGPKLILGGSSGAAAKRAVRLGMDYFPLNAEAYEVFQEELLAQGLPRAKDYSRGGPHLLHVTDDVDAAWEVLAPHFMLESGNYAAWSKTDTPMSGPTGIVPPTAEELRAGGKYVVVTPEEAIDLVRGFTPDTIITLHPLVAGLDPEHGWRTLELFAERVLPVIREINAAQGLATHAS